MTQKSLAESMRCFPLSFRKYLANYIFKKVEKSGNRSNITVISNFLKTENIAKASKKFWQNIASYIILNEKSILRIFCRPQFGESSTMGSIFWDRLGAPLFGLKYCNIPPLSSHQPSSCSGHLQFQYSTSTPSLSRTF